MKLLLCLDCSYIFSLDMDLNKCKCGKTTGQYIDDSMAHITGNCMPIGFNNNSFIPALRLQKLLNEKEDGNKDVCCRGEDFTAFTIPDWAKTIKRI